MMNIDDDQQKKRPQLRLIDCGGSDSKLKTAPVWRSVPESEGAPTQAAQVERLRNEILHLLVEELGLNIDEILREINEKYDSEQEGAFCRLTKLRNCLEHAGLRFMPAVPEMDLTCNGYLILFDAKRLLSLDPEFSLSHSKELDLLTIGELPPSWRSSAWATRQSSESPASPTLLRGANKVNGGYFQVPDDTPWGGESNRLRYGILALELHDVRLSVRDSLAELCNSLLPRTNKERNRVDDLLRNLESEGLRFVDATKEGYDPIPGYLILAWPNRLLRNHPELAVLHPLAWHGMGIA